MFRKLLLATLVGVGGYCVYRKSQRVKAGQDLWAEAVDPVSPGR